MRTYEQVFFSAQALMTIAVAGCSGLPTDIHDEPESDSATLAVEYQPILGAGVNYAETRTFRTCITSTATEKTPGAITRTYNETKITSAKELRQTLDVGASLSAAGLWGKIGAEFSYFKDVDIKDDSFYWLVDANYVLSDEAIKTNLPTFGLTADAKELLEKYGIQAFYEACGTHFYSGQRLGARYTLLYEFQSREDKVVEKLKSKAEYSGFGIKAKARFSRFLDTAERASILKIRTRIVGGGDEIKDYAKDADALEVELQKLRTDLLQHGRGVVLQWSKLSYDIFPDVVAAKRDAGLARMTDAFREDALGFYYDLYTDNRRTIAVLTSRIEMSGRDEPLYVYGPEKIQSMRQSIERLLAQNDEMTRRAKGCIREENDCPTAGLVPLAQEVPDPDQDLTNLGRWNVYPEVPPNSRVFVNFSGRPNIPGTEPRSFDTRRLLIESAAGAVLETKDPHGQPASVLIGDFSIVINPATGRFQPNLCLGDYGTICNFRAVEKPKVLMSDGYPATKLQVSIFDENGFIVDHVQFLIRG